jgi:uncharacterized membrane protein
MSLIRFKFFLLLLLFFYVGFLIFEVNLSHIREKREKKIGRERAR